MRPRLHVFGHIHEDHGVWSDGTTVYVNASNVALNYQTGDGPYIVLDVPKNPNEPVVLVEPCPEKHRDVAEWARRRVLEEGDEWLRPILPYIEKAVSENAVSSENMLNAPVQTLSHRLQLHLKSVQGFRLLRRARNLYRTCCYC